VHGDVLLARPGDVKLHGVGSKNRQFRRVVRLDVLWCTPTKSSI
jgi:hypothetical protein